MLTALQSQRQCGVCRYRIRRNNRTCLNKRTPLPMRKVKKKKFFAKFNPRVSVRVKFNPNPNPMVRFFFFFKGLNFKICNFKFLNLFKFFFLRKFRKFV